MKAANWTKCAFHGVNDLCSCTRLRELFLFMCTFRCDDMGQLTGGLLTCSGESCFTTSTDIHACSYECLQHRHMPVQCCSEYVACCNVCT